MTSTIGINPEVDACVQSREGETPRGTFPIARAPSARYIGHVSDVSRADDPYETLPAYDGPCDRLYDAVAPALPAQRERRERRHVV